MQKDLTKLKIFQKVLGGGATFFETPCTRLCVFIGIFNEWPLVQLMTRPLHNASQGFMQNFGSGVSKH